MNQVNLVGFVREAPIPGTTAAGKNYCRFRIGTDAGYTKDGQRVAKTDWHRIVVWNGQSGPCVQYLKPGRWVSIEGRLDYSIYEKDGVKHQAVDIVANRVEFLGGSTGTQKKAAPAQPQAPAPAAPAAPEQPDVPEWPDVPTDYPF